MIFNNQLPVYHIYKGDVLELVEQATSFVMSHVNIWTGSRNEIGTVSVPTRPELPREAVQEAIVNAICHRDYRNNGSVQVMLFRNRLEIWNPGILPFGLTVKNCTKITNLFHQILCLQSQCITKDLSRKLVLEQKILYQNVRHMVYQHLFFSKMKISR